MEKVIEKLEQLNIKNNLVYDRYFKENKKIIIKKQETAGSSTEIKELLQIYDAIKDLEKTTLVVLDSGDICIEKKL